MASSCNRKTNPSAPLPAWAEPSKTQTQLKIPAGGVETLPRFFLGLTSVLLAFSSGVGNNPFGTVYAICLRTRDWALAVLPLCRNGLSATRATERQYCRTSSGFNCGSSREDSSGDSTRSGAEGAREHQQNNDECQGIGDDYSKGNEETPQSCAGGDP